MSIILPMVMTRDVWQIGNNKLLSLFGGEPANGQFFLLPIRAHTKIICFHIVSDEL